MSHTNTVFEENFDPLILGSFLYGFYTLLVIQAVWKLHNRRAHALYICALVLLWISITSASISYGIYTRIQLVFDNGSPTSMLDAIKETSNLTFFIPELTTSVISRGILIWRCYVMWNTTWSLIILMPLLGATCGFNFYFCVLQGSSNTSTLYTGLSELFAAVTTVGATVIIALKIIIVTRNSHSRYSYATIIDILVQSAALESLIMVVGFVTSIAEYVLLTSHSKNGSLESWLSQVIIYVATLRLLIVAIAPTLIAFRVADEKPRTKVDATGPDSANNPLSRLTFRRSARRTDTEGGVHHTGISTVHVGSVHTDDPVIAVPPVAALDDEVKASGQRESFQKNRHPTGLDSA